MENKINNKEMSGKELASAIEKCCKEINIVIAASNVLENDYTFFDKKRFDLFGKSQMIDTLAFKHGVSVEHIKKILS